MFQRHIYAHWLDPDYYGEKAVSKNLLTGRMKEFEGILKMHALAGDSICLSDVQLIESRLLLHLFQDPEFLRFISDHPDFLRLVARPSDALGAKSQRLAQVESGMGRVLELEGFYFPPTFHSPETMREVIKLFRGIENETEADALFSINGAFTKFLRDYTGSDREFVAGLYSALKHFIFNMRSTVVAPATGRESSYYTELRSIYDRLGTENRPVKDILSRTLALAEKQSDQHRRGAIFAALPHAATSGHADREIYLTVIQAWNLAVGCTIGADSDSAFCFRDAFPIPIHAGVTSGTTFITRAAEEKELFTEFQRCSWHPASLRWATLSKIRTSCSSQIAAFQRVLSGTLSTDTEISTQNIDQKFRALTDCASQIVSKDHQILPQAPAWVVGASHIAPFGIAAFASVIFGFNPLELLSVAPPAAVGAYEVVSKAVNSANAKEVGDALQSYGLQYNILRTPADGF